MQSKFNLLVFQFIKNLFKERITAYITYIFTILPNLDLVRINTNERKDLYITFVYHHKNLPHFNFYAANLN